MSPIERSAGGGGSSSGPTWTIASTPPASPANGDIWVYTADNTNGVYWHFIYDSTQTTYKWRFVGGSPLSAAVSTDETNTTVNTWVNLATDGPSITPGRAGDYLCFGQAAAYGIAGGNASYIGIANGNTNATFNASLLTVAGTAAQIPGFYGTMTGIASTDTLKLRYFQTAVGTGHWLGRSMFIWPVRVI